VIAFKNLTSVISDMLAKVRNRVNKTDYAADEVYKLEREVETIFR
jgi:hypothetical protein